MRFLFIDRVTHLECDRRVVAIWSPSLAEDFFDFHFPARPVMPGSLVIECFAQAGTILIETSGGFRIKGLPGFLSNVKFTREVIPGHELRIEMEAEQHNDEGVLLRATAIQRGARCASATIGMIHAPIETYYTPESMWMYRQMYERWLAEAECSGFDAPPLERLRHAFV